MSQVGTTLVAGEIPAFDEIVIIADEGGWSPSEITPASLTQSASGLANAAKSTNVALQVETSWVVKDGNDALRIHDLVTETTGGNKWIVTALSETHEASTRLMQSGTLVYDPYFNTQLA